MLKIVRLVKLGVILSLVGVGLLFLPKAIKKLLDWLSQLLVRGWIQPLENILRQTTLDYSPSRPERFNRWLTWLKDLGWLILSRGRVNIKRFEGADWSVTFVGDTYIRSETQLLAALFPEPPQVSQIGRRFIWQIPAMVPQFLADTDMVVCQINRLIPWQPNLKYVFKCPPFVRMVLAVHRPLEEIKANMSRERRRLVTKLPEQGYTYEISHNLQDFELFYHKMYQPYALLRHEDWALVSSYETQLDFFHQGDLLIIKHQGQPVGGLLARPIGQTYLANILGIHEDHFDLLNEGLSTALYWFTMVWAKENNLTHVDFGWTQARMFHGVFWHKLLWGFEAWPNLGDDHTLWMFAAQDMPAKLGQFLNKAGFIAEIEGDYRCVFLGDGDFRPTDQKLAQVEKVSPRVGLKPPVILGAVVTHF